MVRVASVNGAAGDVTEMRVISRSAARAGPGWRPTKQSVRLNARRRATGKKVRWQSARERRGADATVSMPCLC